MGVVRYREQSGKHLLAVSISRFHGGSRKVLSASVSPIFGAALSKLDETETPTDLPVGLSADLPVQPFLQKNSGFRKNQITLTTRFVSSHSRGVSRSSRTRGGMRWTRTVLLTRALDADGEVVWF
jgi:hypothetical protein